LEAPRYPGINPFVMQKRLEIHGEIASCWIASTFGRRIADRRAPKDLKKKSGEAVGDYLTVAAWCFIPEHH